MGADHQVDTAVEQAHQRRFARAALVAPRQQRHARAGGFGHAAQALVMLAREDLGGSEQGGLRPRLDRDQHRFERDDGLARPDIALQQPQHRRFLRQIAFDLGNRAFLRAGQRERQVELGAIAAVAQQLLALALAIVRADQHQREAVGEQFVIGQPVARRRILALVHQHQRIAPAGPAFLVHLRRLDPLGQFGGPRERLIDKPR